MDRHFAHDTADRIRSGDHVSYAGLRLYVEAVLAEPTLADPMVALRVVELTGALGMVPWTLRLGPGEVVWLGRELARV